MSEQQFHARIREWVQNKAGGDIVVENDTKIFATSVLKSIHLMDLILFIEELSEKTIDVEKLGAGALRDVNAIVENFFESKAD